MSVFQGGRSIAAVEAVCGPGLDLDVIDGLESLLNKSLLRQEEGLPGDDRFVMLETIHEYARERLRDSGEGEAIHLRHAEYFKAWVEQFRRELRAGANQYKRFAWLDVEYANMRTALEWSLAGAQPEPGLRIIGALWPYWWRQGQHLEWRYWVNLAEKSSDEATPVVRAGVLRAKGNMLFAFNRLSETRRVLTDALAIYRSLGDDFETGTALVELSLGSIGIAGEYEEAVEACQEGIALLRRIDAKAEIAYGLNVLGELTRAQGDNDLAQSAYEECLTVAIEIGDKLREGFQYGNLGAIAMNRGDFNLARERLKRAGSLAAELGNRWFVLDNLAYQACAIGGCGKPRRAARLLGASEALHSSFEIELQASDLPDYERWVAMVREELGEETFNALREEGSAMTLEQAVAYARNDADDE